MTLKKFLMEALRSFASTGKRGKMLYCGIRGILGIVSPRRSVALDNLRKAFPDKEREWHLSTLNRMYDHFSWMTVEYLALLRDPSQALRWVIEVRGKEILDSLISEKKGCVILASHGGNWELLSAWLCQSGYPLQAAVRDPNDEELADLMEQYRRRVGLVTLRKEASGLREMIRLPGRGGFIGLVADQDGGPSGVPVHFLGRPCTMPSGPASIAVLADVPIVPVSIERISPFSHKVTVDGPIFPPDGGSKGDKIGKMCLEVNDALEKMVLRCPEEWLWMHRRWKTSPEDSKVL